MGKTRSICVRRRTFFDGGAGGRQGQGCGACPAALRAATTAPSPLESRNSTSVRSSRTVLSAADPGGPGASRSSCPGDVRETILELDCDGGIDPLHMRAYDAHRRSNGFKRTSSRLHSDHLLCYQVRRLSLSNSWTQAGPEGGADHGEQYVIGGGPLSHGPWAAFQGDLFAPQRRGARRRRDIRRARRRRHAFR